VTILLLVSGLVLLVAGGELLVRGAARLAFSFGISPLIIGLTVVAFGTSSPELAVSVKAALEGSADIAVGNVVGSNIFNVLFILGASAIIVPLLVSQQLIRLDVPVMIVASAVFLLFARDGVLSRAESLLLVAALVAYIAMQLGISRRAPLEPRDAARYTGRWYADVALIVVGLVLLVLGARWLVDSAANLARSLGVSELVIGLTIVAAGTSMPEAATSIIAGFRKQRDIAVGNVIGSNIFNILAVLGITGAVSTGGVPVSAAAVSFDIPIMIAVAVLCFPIFFSGYAISRSEGVLFLGYYGLFTTYIIIDAARPGSVDVYSRVVMTFVIPVTLATVFLFALLSWHRDRNPS
jgi:cation:H+ antiporter